MVQRSFWSVFLLFWLWNGFWMGFGGSFENSSIQSTQPQSMGNLATNPQMTDECEIDNTRQGTLETSDSRIFWFLQVSDTQMAWWEWAGTEPRGPTDGRNGRVRRFFNTTQKVISPVMIVNTGDLVDGAYEKYLLREDGQRIGEWAYYNETLSLPEMGLNSSYYFDMPGNHDINRSPGFTHFLNYSFSGNKFHTDQYVVHLNLSWGQYTFLTVSTPEEYGLEMPFGLGGHLSTAELDWLNTKLQKYAVSNLTFVMGHHPITGIFSRSSSSGQNFLKMLQSNNVDSYLFGHMHENTIEEYDGLVAMQANRLDEGDGSYRIVAVDNDAIATTCSPTEEWPVGLITSPTDQVFARGDYWSTHPNIPLEIRALAWDPMGIASVEWRADQSETWLPMSHKEGPLYQATFDSDLADGQSHSLEIRINNVNGKQRIQAITYNSQEIAINEWWDWWIFYLIGFVGLVTVALTLPVYLRKHNPARWQKTTRSTVDKTPAKWLLLKCLALLVLPLTFGFMDAELFTGVFSLFLISAHGILYSDILLIFFGATAIWMLPQVFTLSPRFRRTLRFFTFLGLFVECFLFVFYLLHYPTIAWIAPGYYAVIGLDIRIHRYSPKFTKNPK